MKRLLLLAVLMLTFVTTASADTRERISPAKVCVGTKKCVSSAWPLSSVEKSYGIRGTEVEEGVKEICIRRDGTYLRLQYDLRSVAGLKRPAVLDVASNGPPEKCEVTSVRGPSFSVSPVALGESEAKVKTVLGDPDEVWEPQTSDHGILAGERGFVYSGTENGFVLVVLRNHLVVRVAGSVLP